MQHHRTAIFGGLAALTSFVAVGLGTAAGAAGGYGAPAIGSSAPAPTVKTVIRLPGGTKPATLETGAQVQVPLASATSVQASSRPTATGTQGKLTALRDASGHQVTYNGHFLYTFIDDAPGHVTGQGVSNFFVATPRLKAIGSTPKATAAASSSSSSGSGYGY